MIVEEEEIVAQIGTSMIAMVTEKGTGETEVEIVAEIETGGDLVVETGTAGEEGQDLGIAVQGRNQSAVTQGQGGLVLVLETEGGVLALVVVPEESLTTEAGQIVVLGLLAHDLVLLKKEMLLNPLMMSET
ncbi:hypothetical protein ElyMa_002580700 [Elysia marginata]|uniref:Uncharacterized protein n=1 Tax=Elysia marginata TaxID=1093978 RepID=A0AAV4H363_9GAST|nr:hypothetical protein ElyMa_002580700 [Elysia marginata]